MDVAVREVRRQRGRPVGDPEEFTTQGDAESWLGEYWRDLLDGGADQATLAEDGTTVYGPMPLNAEG
ncbi:hypothetical protein SLA_1761 [Streptomyces laurentii]|uniref:Uncharacterized protein n=1 Tax=Streptomyces laurentii TaxID=39478 RepID=A0A160NVM5_STRLU|nr:hypothetical protein SLA_1761 [Streptomyces laurentii]